MTASPSLRTSLRSTPLALRALFAVVSVIAAFAYGINAWQVFGFAQHVWRLPLPLCVGAAVVADSLSLAGLFATYLLRAAQWQVRTYAWVVFLGMTTVSIAAAESFAAWRKLPARDQVTYGWPDAQVASGAIVVALALATHLLIVCRRHAQPQPVLAPPVVVVSADPTPVAEPVTATVTASKPDHRKPAAKRAAARWATAPADDARKMDAARRVLIGKESIAAVARDQKPNPVSRRTIENWIRPYRSGPGAAALLGPFVPTELAEPTDPLLRTNGHHGFQPGPVEAAEVSP